MCKFSSFTLKSSLIFQANTLKYFRVYRLDSVFAPLFYRGDVLAPKTCLLLPRPFVSILALETAHEVSW